MRAAFSNIIIFPKIIFGVDAGIIFFVGLRLNVNIISQHLSDGKMHMHMMVKVNDGIIKQHRKKQKAGNNKCK